MVSYKRLLLIFRYIAYEISYYLIGFKALVDDAISKSYNHCSLVDADTSTAVVTGGARGIGCALVKKLLMCQMNVIIGCRDVDAGLEKVNQIRAEGVTGGHVFIYPLDLKSLKSVKKFALLVTSNHQELHLLINNAGIMFPPYCETAEGYESQWGVNYLGPALLAHLLLPQLEKGSKSRSILRTRIVNVSSCAHLAAQPINFETINVKESYIPSLSYAQSKLALIAFSIELDRRLKNAGSSVSVHSVHPGIVNTELFDGTLLKKTMPWVLSHFCKTVDEGATSVLFACLSPILNDFGGSYSSNCKLVTPGKMALSRSFQQELFDYTQRTLQIPTFGTTLSP